jgi:signal transduction histidine kinase
MVPCRVETLIERTVALCQPRAQTKNVTLVATAQPALPELNADAEKLSQALVNVVSNGIDAVAERGHVWIRASREQADIRFEITDDGPGIQLHPGEDPFSPFFSKKEGGTGLGLAICHRIVTAHAGSVTYGNREEGGARFTVCIPIERGGLR